MTNNTDKFEAFLDKLIKEQGKDGARQFVMQSATHNALVLEYAMYEFFTDEDLESIEKIESDEAADQEIARLFELRVGKTPEAFVAALQEAIQTGYLDDKSTTTPTPQSLG